MGGCQKPRFTVGTYFLNEGNPFSTKKSIVTVLRAGPEVIYDK